MGGPLQTRPAAEYKPIDYPKPDGKLSFPLLTNLARSGTNHEGDQPSHLRIKVWLCSHWRGGGPRVQRSPCVLP